MYTRRTLKYRSKAQLYGLSLAALILVILLMILCSCSVKQRVATTTNQDEQIQSSSSADSSGVSRKKITSNATLKDWFYKTYGRNFTMYFDQTIIEPPLLDSAGKVIAPGRTIKTHGKIDINDSSRYAGHVAAAHDSRTNASDSSNTKKSSDTQTDTKTTVQEKALPVERTAMWVCFTVLVVVGYLIFRRLKK